MGKYSEEEKLEMIEEYENGNHTINWICKKHGVSASYLREILQRYEKSGSLGEGKGQKNMPKGRHPGEFKLKVVKERISSGQGYREIARKYSLSHAVVMQWERIYLEDGERGLLEERRGKMTKEGCPTRGRPPKNTKAVEKDLIAEVQRLRMENAYLKKLNALVSSEERSRRREK